MFYATPERPPLLAIDPFKAIVAPRPIGWISTISAAGAINLAPYSYCNAICATPPLIMFSSDGWKDTVANCAETGEFVFNLATFDVAEKMNETSSPLPKEVSEFDFVGLEPAASVLVRPPRVAVSPAALECRVTQIFRPLTAAGAETDNHVVIGEVVGVHIADDCLVEGRFDIRRAGAIARCGYSDFVRVAETFRMARPKGGGNWA